jgi:hypothetical protein
VVGVVPQHPPPHTHSHRVSRPITAPRPAILRIPRPRQVLRTAHLAMPQLGREPPARAPHTDPARPRRSQPATRIAPQLPVVGRQELTAAILALLHRAIPQHHPSSTIPAEPSALVKTCTNSGGKFLKSRGVRRSKCRWLAPPGLGWVGMAVAVSGQFRRGCFHADSCGFVAVASVVSRGQTRRAGSMV